MADRRLFYSGMALICLVITFIGFSPSFYIPSAGRRGNSDLLELHGVLFTTWLLLFFVQAALVPAGRKDLHRRLGVFSLALAVPMVGVAALAVFKRAPSNPNPLVVTFAVTMTDLALFVAFAALAAYYRKSAEFHKRLMLLATIAIIDAPIERLPIIKMNLAVFNPPMASMAYAVTDLLVVAGMAYDWRTIRRIHPAYIWGGLVLVVTQLARICVIGFFSA